MTFIFRAIPFHSGWFFIFGADDKNNFISF